MNKFLFLVLWIALSPNTAWAKDAYIDGVIIPSEKTFPDNLPTFRCDTQPLTRDGLKMALTNRDRFAKACLACIGDECAMRVWPAGYEDRETLCKNTYCSPKRVKKMVFAEGYNMSYKYRYKISATGKASVIEGEYLSGEPKGVTGKATQQSHLSLIKKSLDRVEYEPIMINGKAKSLINLETIFETGANYDE
jgi:hypothetical protein